MPAGHPPITVPAEPVQPYLHLDNRGLVIYDGRRCVIFQQATLGWVRETLELLLEEKRATRRQSDHVLGGFVSEDGGSATVYAGPVDAMVTLTVSTDALRALDDRLHGR